MFDFVIALLILISTLYLSLHKYSLRYCTLPFICGVIYIFGLSLLLLNNYNTLITSAPIHEHIFLNTYMTLLSLVISFVSYQYIKRK